MRSNNSKPKKIKDPSVLQCSNDSVKKFVFLKEKDFLCEFLPTIESYKAKQTKIHKLKRKLPEKIYLKYLQSFREQLISDLSLLKKEYSPQITEKYEDKPDEPEANKNLSEAQKKKLKRQRKMIEQQNKIRKLKQEFKGNFEFFKADVQIGKNKSGKWKLIKDVIQGYFDKKLYKTEFALGFNYFETNYNALEIITKYNKKQSDIFMHLSNILNVGKYFNN